MDADRVPWEGLPEAALEALLASPLGQKLERAMEVFGSVLRHLYALAGSEDGPGLNALRIGTVFQIFLVDVLASGKRAGELTAEDWKQIGEKVSKFAILQEGQTYSEFVFTRYGDFIRLSALKLGGLISPEQAEELSGIAASVDWDTQELRAGRLTESAYAEACLWLSLEGMMKLLAASLTAAAGPELKSLTEAVFQLAFEYGRYVLFRKEQAILTEYLRRQRELDEELKQRLADYLAELQVQAGRFEGLVSRAFSGELHESLLASAALARAAGAKPEELLTTVEEVDAFFLE